jgi:hypothetical protein
MRRDWAGVKSGIGGLYRTIGGIGLVLGAKRVLDFRQALGALQAKMLMSTPDAEQLGREILGVARAHNIAKDSVLGAIQVFQDEGGVVERGRKTLSRLGMISKATGADIADLARVQATFLRAGMAPEESIKAIELLNAQADAATVSMADLGKVMGELFATAGGMGERFRNDVNAVAAAGKLIQVVGSAMPGQSERAKTASLAVMREMVMKADQIKKKFGVKIFDEKGMRDTEKIMREIFQATGGGGAKQLAKIFGGEAQPAVQAFMGAIRQQQGRTAGQRTTGFFGFEPPDVGKGTDVLSKIAAVGAGDVERQYKIRMQGVAKEAEEVQGALGALDHALQVHGGSLLKWASENKASAAATGVGLAAAVKFGPMLLRRLGGKGAGAAAGAIGGLLPGGGVQPVFVVNMPGATFGQAAGYGLGPGGGAAGAGKIAGKTAGKLAKVGRAAGIAGGALSALLVGYAVGTMFDRWLGLSDKMAGAMNRVSAFASKHTGGRWVDPTTAAKKVAEMRSRIEVRQKLPERAKEMAVRFASMKARGLTAGGQEITKGLVAGKMAQRFAAEFGKEELQKMIPLLQKIADKELRAIVKPADGLDKAKVEIDRGPRQ